MESQISTFDYGQLDGETASFLQQKEQNMREIVGKAYTALGRELKEAQDALARRGSKYEGIFELWYTSLGWKKEQVYRLIRRYNLVTNCDEVQRDLLENMPVSLSYEISAPSSESTEPKRQAKQAVLNGDIRTRKEYLELVARLEAEETARKEAEARAEKAEQDYELVRETLEAVEAQPPKVEVRTEYVRDGAIEEELRKYRERYGDISACDGVTRMTAEKDVTGNALLFARDVRDFIKRYSFLSHFKNEIASVNNYARTEYESSLAALEDFIVTLNLSVSGNARADKPIIIDCEVM